MGLFAGFQLKLNQMCLHVAPFWTPTISVGWNFSVQLSVCISEDLYLDSCGQRHAGTSPVLLRRRLSPGWSTSPHLFLLCTQLLTEFTKISTFKGFSVTGKEMILSQLADDTTLFLKDLSQIPPSIDLMNTFSAASGLCLNINKCELLAL